MDTFDIVRMAKWEATKREREQRIVMSGHTEIGSFDCDIEGRINMLCVAVRLLADPDIPFVRYTCADNVRRTFSRSQFLSAVAEIESAIANKYDVSDSLRCQIDAARSADDIVSIRWPDDWKKQ